MLDKFVNTFKSELANGNFQITIPDRETVDGMPAKVGQRRLIVGAVRVTNPDGGLSSFMVHYDLVLQWAKRASEVTNEVGGLSDDTMNIMIALNNAKNGVSVQAVSFGVSIDAEQRDASTGSAKGIVLYHAQITVSNLMIITTPEVL